jgi:hypothetical protein
MRRDGGMMTDDASEHWISGFPEDETTSAPESPHTALGWRVATSLLVLRHEVDVMAPNRSRASDGTIGDAAHQSHASDHNPDRRGVVCAMDLTHDRAHGADMGHISERLRTHRHPALAYLIFGTHITSAQHGWKWAPYHGIPHSSHLHVSVAHSSMGDARIAWGVLASKPLPVPPPHPVPTTGLGTRYLRLGDSGSDVAFVQRYLGAARAGNPDGEFGLKTQAGVMSYQALRGLGVDGVVGQKTWESMGISWLP